MLIRSRVSIARRFIKRLNSADIEGLAAMMRDDFIYVDSRLARIEGKTGCVEMFRRFVALDTGYSIIVESASRNGDDVLIKGRTQSSDPELVANCLWKCRIENGKVAYWQSFRADEPPALARMLASEFVVN